MKPGAERLLAAYERLGFDVRPVKEALALWQSNDNEEPPKRRDKDDARSDDERLADRKVKRLRSLELRCEELTDEVRRSIARLENEFYFDMDDAVSMARMQYASPAWVALATFHHARNLRHAGQVQRTAPVQEASAHRFAAAHVDRLRADAAIIREADPGAPGSCSRLGAGRPGVDDETDGEVEERPQRDQEGLRILAVR